MKHTNGNYVNEGGLTDLHFTEENKSNAKLISKAPEMYEALKEIHTDAEFFGKSPNKHYTIKGSHLAKIYQLLKEIES
jgi:hypothetical protein